MTSTPNSPNQKEPKDVRYRQQHFPDFDKLVFDKSKKGFVPLPIIMRKAMKFLSAAELRALIYLQTRASQYGICYPTLDEIAHDLDLKGTRNLTPHIKSLEKMRFISSAASGGRRFFLVHDPVVALTHLLAEGKISPKDQADINELLGDLNRDPIIAPKVGATVTPISQPKGA